MSTGSKIGTLRQRVEALATRLVLGSATEDQWAELVGGIRQEAEAAGRADVARLAIETLEQLNTSSGEAAFTANIARMQAALLEASVPAAPAKPSLGEDPEMIRDFIIESREHLTQVEVQMMTLEKDPGDIEAINTVFRGFHTIKGLAGFLDLVDIREVAHETETLLDLARNQELRITSAVVDVVLAAADFLKGWLGRLDTLLAGGDPGAAPATEELLVRVRQGAQSGPAPAASVAAVGAAPAPRPEEAVPGRTAERASESARSVKVDTAKLDALVDLAGEMVIAQSMVRHQPELANLNSPALSRSLAQLARITAELQKTAMSMRMVPVGGLFQKMNRLVRDLARKTGKQAEMEAFGADTELDRNVVEELADPLMHMVRNAVDHGLEPADERLAAGKDACGRVRLKASHQAGHIVIEVADDGRGLVRDKILAKARQRGLVEDGSNLTDSEVFNFIFHPGFSTAAQLTDVSGRGVGMDVVKRQIQKLRGRVEIESRPGNGTSFFLRLPLTLAMIDGLVVGVGEERYVVPIFTVREGATADRVHDL